MLEEPPTAAPQPSRPRPTDAVAALRPYHATRPLTPVDLILDSNEGAPPPPELLAQLAKIDADLLRRYPRGKGDLESLLAERFKLEPTQVLVTAGGDEAIDRVCRAMLGPGREIIIPAPSFEMIPHYASLSGGRVVHVNWRTPDFPLNAIRDVISEDTAVISFVTPNNPTGFIASGAALRELSQMAPHAVILADLAYAEFADEDLTDAALGLPNVVVTRTFSKAWGLAGLRVGYAMGPDHVIGWLRAAGGPYNVSAVSLMLAEQQLRHGAKAMQRYVDSVREERRALGEQLTALGATVGPSEGNFLFPKFGNASLVRDLLASQGVAVRHFGNRLELTDGLRITLPGDADDFARLVNALQVALAPEAILFDLEGVLITTGSPEATPDELLVDPRVLASVRKRCKTGLVTNRVRRETAPCLSETGLEAHFDVVICAEDGPLKPDPGKVRLALHKLGVSRAWMLGDSTTDIAAARGAGVAALGVMRPDDQPQRCEALLQAGAGRVLKSAAEIGELLP